MLILLTQGWPWILLGGLLIVWGASILNFSPKDWVVYLVSLFWLPFTDDTQKEKQALAEPADKVAEDNPGCFILLLGIVMLVVGIVKLLT